MRKAFTLVELMIVVVIIGVMAGFSIPKISGSVIRAKKRDAVLNLNVIHSSNLVYRARNGVNLTAANLAAINDSTSGLGLNIIANGATYDCDGTSCYARGSGFTLTATLGSPLSTTNPSCAGTNCS